jgi:hypothetical protein
MSAHGKGGKRRKGVHRHRDSPDTHRWNREEMLPKCPPWMPPATYQALAALRRELETP